MARKRAQITAAAHASFLREGFAGSSVNRIAGDAGVSIKTLYRHFEDKDDLFTAVMLRACSHGPEVDHPWFDWLPEEGLVEAGVEILSAVLSPDQVALYRVVLVEGQRVPAVAKAYREAFLQRRFRVLTDYFARWPETLRERLSDPQAAAETFNALVTGDLVEQALLGAPVPSATAIRERARAAAHTFLTLVRAGAPLPGGVGNTPTSS
ncbi:TetR/AcrR family transcriptional regulator [Micromonospora tulbaghiae]|uniref:TetR/AcrR family transcriptional regulator n=1 Tax=Micromonospora tulbaghiae TaxID=479978 RepID=UPI0033F8DA62